jgi:hypothetical protein
LSGVVDGGDLAVWFRHFGQGITLDPTWRSEPAIVAEGRVGATTATADALELPANVLLAAPIATTTHPPLLAPRRRSEFAPAVDAAMALFRVQPATRGEQAWDEFEAVDSHETAGPSTPTGSLSDAAFWGSLQLAGTPRAK